MLIYHFFFFIKKEVLAALGTFECEEEDGYHFGVYELNDGTLYQGTWKDKERFGKGF